MNQLYPYTPASGAAPDGHSIARMHDEWFSQIPDDLYIPPKAFQILLEHFEGPLDFLLYLVHKNGLNLVELDIAPIATQYLHYIEGMKALNIELAADYLVMAASLADIKSRLLLPKPQIDKPEEDPRQDLLARLQQYAQIKQAATGLNARAVLERDVFEAHASTGIVLNTGEECFEAGLLLQAMQILLARPRLQSHQIAVEAVQLEERIAFIRSQINTGQPISFDRLLNPAQGHMGIVVTFMAVLELVRQGELGIISNGLQQPLAVEGRLGHAA
ncbi:segregation and condensation protein A [Alkanindiges sp. WGS2144]|uniref:segregation and condensation protein A n=1 Tax=Alkanindiges sp. WGS2144 TaxID=3366808 RepID=UPI00375147A2